MSARPESFTPAALHPAKPVEFFKLNAAYLIDPTSDADELLNDVSCWLESVTETINSLACELTAHGSQMQANPVSAGKMLWGAFHLLEMTRGAVRSAHSAMLKAEAKS